MYFLAAAKFGPIILNLRVHTGFPLRSFAGIYDKENATNPWANIPKSVILSDEHTALAKRAAAESMTLLRCDAGVLPVLPAAGTDVCFVVVLHTACSQSLTSS